MTTVVPINQSALDVLRDQIAPNATDDELRWLSAVGQRLDLDPIAGHIILIPRYDGRLKRMVMRPQITAEGRLALADRTGELDGFTGPEWTGPRNDDGSHTWVDVWDGDDDHPPHAARAFVYRHGRAHPVNGTVRWIEFAQRDSNGKLMATWKQMPSHMLGKVALSLAIRRAFPGIVIGDDVEDDSVVIEQRSTVAGGEVSPVSPPPAAVEGGDGDGQSAVSSPSPTATGHNPGPPDRSVENVVGSAAVMQRWASLPLAQRQQLEAWRKGRNFPEVPNSTAVVGAYQRELTRLEAEAAEERDTYGDDVDQTTGEITEGSAPAAGEGG